MPALRRRLIGPRTTHMEKRLQNHLGFAVMFCHLLPAILLPTFVACGWSRVRYRRFLLMSTIAAALYSSVMLFFLTTCGQALVQHLGMWAWAVLALVMVGLAIRSRLHPATVGEHFMGSEHKQPLAKPSHAGMPPPPPASLPRTSFAEHIPTYLFYAPLAFHWVYLGIRHRGLLLPTVAIRARKWRASGANPRAPSCAR